MVYMKKRQSTNIDLNKAIATTVIGYVCLVVAVYFLMGYQLHYRSSRGNFTQPAAEVGTVELVQGAVVEQEFSVEIQRLQTISVQWGTYYRANSGTVTMELMRQWDGAVLMSQSFSAAEITEGGVTVMTSEEPIETVYGAPLLLRITADSPPGGAVSPMMNLTATEEGDGGDEFADFSLTLNGTPTEGVLCFSATGEDYIWTGLHYWEFAAGLGAVLALAVIFIWYRYKRGKHSYVVKALIAVRKYKFLIRQLVGRDFKTKYKRSVLGVFWSFLNPLLTMAVQYVVFSNLFRFDVPHYQAYLIVGIVFFNFFSEATGMALTSIIGNASLITKVYVPKYIYPLTRVLSSLVNLVISMIPLLLVTMVCGIVPTKAYLLVPFSLVCLAVFSLGIGLLLAALMVFFRDVQFLWGVLTMIWMYVTPIFYPASILPKTVAWVLHVNPLYYYITFARTCFIDGISPEPVMYFQCAVMALVPLLLGALVFRRAQDRFVLYL